MGLPFFSIGCSREFCQFVGWASPNHIVLKRSKRRLRKEDPVCWIILFERPSAPEALSGSKTPISFFSSDSNSGSVKRLSVGMLGSGLYTSCRIFGAVSLTFFARVSSYGEPPERG